MKSIHGRYGLANFDKFSITGFLIPTGHYAQKIGLINLLEKHIEIKMKTVLHSPVEKVIELFASIISGCPDVKTINNRLVPDRLTAAAWCQNQFADQSQVNEVLHRITPENLLQLEGVFQELFARQSLARRNSPAERLVVGVDMTGLAVSPTSKSYEGAAFGFMQKDKGKGYKLSCPYPLRVVLGKTKTAKPGVNQYFHLVTTIPKRMKDARTLLRFYNARQTIEAFIKTGKNVLNFKYFHVRNFYGTQFTLVLPRLALTWYPPAPGFL